jgi:hypothetical protein
VLDQLPASLPALTAIATLIAAGIGAVVAIVVALVNAWSARRIAVDTAHREFRTELAESAVEATRRLLEDLHNLDTIARTENEEAWRDAFRTMERRSTDLKVDLRTPHDPVFAAAVKLFTQRRAQLKIWLSLRGRNQIPPGLGLLVATDYIREAAEIVQVAAEAYIFGVRPPRKRAEALLKKIDPMPLNKRVLARQKVYEDAFGPDDGSLIDIDARPEEVVDSKD